VKIGSSPAWMQQRLIACGVRPINNIVDITNYVLLEYGQPLHVFDADRLAGRTILVRRARVAERMTTLDEVARELTGDMLVIADAERAIAVAGVMGGLGSEVTPKTVNVVLESALFDPVTVRRTARALGLVTEASYRFERGVDPVGVETASQRAAELMCSIAGGCERTLRDAGAKPSSKTVVSVREDRLNRWLGTRLSPATIRTTLAKLSCRVMSSEGQATLRVAAPSFRRDLREAVDLYEEVARLTGYKQIPSRVPTASLAVRETAASARFHRVQALRRSCASLGLSETINWSLVSSGDLARIGGPEAVLLANPLSQDHAHLRPSLLIGLLHVVRRNVARGAARVCAFELGQVFSPGRESAERLRLGLVLSGVWARDWQGTQACDFFRLKGLIELLASRWAGVSIGMRQTDAPWSEPGQGADVLVNGQPLGDIGQVAQRIVEALDIEQDVWFAELDAETLLGSWDQVRSVQSPIAFPPVRRDVSIVVADTIPFEEVDRVIREVGGPLAVRIELIDRYAGRQTPPGKHSLTFSIEYRDRARTLTAEAVDALHRCIGQALVSRFAAQLR
jgi:phenylalanyl-tRNA synthetase beta chain